MRVGGCLFSAAFFCALGTMHLLGVKCSLREQFGSSGIAAAGDPSARVCILKSRAMARPPQTAASLLTMHIRVLLRARRQSACEARKRRHAQELTGGEATDCSPSSTGAITPPHRSFTSGLYRKVKGRYRPVDDRRVIAAVLAGNVARGPQLNVKSVHDYVAVRLGGLEYEVFCCIYLDIGCRVIECENLFRGSLGIMHLHPREVAKQALIHNADALIVAHNHPSGLIEPSPEDRLITMRLKHALELIDVRLLDQSSWAEEKCARWQNSNCSDVAALSFAAALNSSATSRAFNRVVDEMVLQRGGRPARRLSRRDFVMPRAGVQPRAERRARLSPALG